jgi:hypothetical protein
MNHCAAWPKNGVQRTDDVDNGHHSLLYMESLPLVPELLVFIVQLDLGQGETLLSVRPILLLVCKEWNAILMGVQSAELLDLFRLARRNYVSIIKWLLKPPESANGIYASIMKWLRPRRLSELVTNEILAGASAGGHESLCHLAKKWGAMDFDSMLGTAARYGHDSLCHLAREWGATDFDFMLSWAANGGHEGVCRLAKEWGATNFDSMLAGAAYRGHESLCVLAKEWGATG